nr:putative ribonuclease H-like domain-containing protein [Tanacetum cinerariifolium]
PSSSAQSKEQDDKTTKEDKRKSPVEFVTGYRDLNAEFQDCSKNSSNEVTTASSIVSTVGQNSFNSTNTFSKMQKVWVLVDLPYGKRAISTKWVYRNKKDERGTVIRNKAKLVAQRHTQEEEIDYKEVFAPVARIEAIRVFLAYASFMGFMVY